MGQCWRMHLEQRQRIVVGTIEVLKCSQLAEGAYGEVWTCKGVNSQALYALKEIRLQTPALREMFLKEQRLLTKLANSRACGIIKLFAGDIKTIHGEEIGYLLEQLGTLTLFDEVRSRRMSVQDIVRILQQVTDGVAELHTLNIFHLDLKPQNLVLVGERYKICDLGSAIEKEVDFAQLSRRQRNQFVDYIESNSTLFYRSPEMIDSEKKLISGKSDVWMIGCIGYFMLYRRQPFEGQGKLAIMSSNVVYPTAGPLELLIQAALTIDANKRVSLRELQKQLSLIT